MAFAEDDDVIQTLSADRTDKTLSVRVLPRRSRRGDDLRDPHRSNAMTECPAIGFVSVPQQIARCSVPGKRLGHLRESQSCVGFGVTSKWTIRLRSILSTIKV